MNSHAETADDRPEAALGGRWITVIQVFRALGIEPTPDVSWSVGSRVATMYAAAFGRQPPKDNRPKTSGQGTHCFALYPPEWRGRIEAAVRDVVQQDAAQQDLFAGG